MKDKEKYDNEFEEMAPFLSKIEKKNPFDVPAGYFDALPSIIQEACIQSKKESIWLRIQIYIFRPQIAISIFSFALLGVFIFQFLPQKNLQNMAVVSISAADITESDLLANLDESMLIESLPAQETQSQNSKTEIEDYLIDNNADLSNIDDN